MYITGINPTQTWTSDDYTNNRIPFALGSIGMGHDGRVYQLVRADSGGWTGAGYVVAMKSGAADGDMVDSTMANAGTGHGARVGVAMAAVPANGVGWLCVYGLNVPVYALASCVKHTRLNTTATPGALDDDSTAGAEIVWGIVLDSTRPASAGTTPATVNWPYIGATI